MIYVAARVKQVTLAQINNEEGRLFNIEQTPHQRSMPSRKHSFLK